MNWADPRVALRICIRGSCPPLWTLQKVTRNSHSHLHVSHPSSDGCPLSISVFSGRIWCLNPPPFTPEEPVSCHASNAEIRSQRCSGLVFLGKSCKQTLIEPSLPNHFHPTVVPRLPPSTSVPHLQRTRKRGLIYLFMYLFLSISFASKPVFTPAEPEYFADNRWMRSRRLNDWEKFDSLVSPAISGL